MSAVNITDNLLKYYIQFLETSFKKEKTPKRKFKWSDSYVKLNRGLEELSSQIFKSLINAKDNENVIFRIQKWKRAIKSDKSLITNVINNLDKYFDWKWVRIESYSVIEELEKINSFDESEIKTLGNYSEYSDFLEYFEWSSYEVALNELRYSHFDDDWKLLIWKVNYYIQDEEWKIEVTDETNEYHPVVNYIFSEAWDVITESDRAVLQYAKDKQQVIDYLMGYQNHDFFDMMQDIDRDSKFSDKSRIYFNILEIKLKNLDTKKLETFPLFFAECELSYSVQWTKSYYDIIFSQWISINRKLVRYLTQKVDGAIDWTIAPSERRFEFWKWLQNDLNENITRLLDKLHINKSISLDWKSEINEIEENKVIITSQSSRSVPVIHSLKINNNCSFSVDEKEHVLIDLDDLSNEEKTKIWKYITWAIDNILHKNPVSFDIEWEINSTDFSDKLSYVSPLPLNEQQLQILKALDTEWCNSIVVEWPPGTWKSHSIVAMLQHCIQNNKKVLFVSDKKEALDVVEEKINQVFDWDLPSPIVRIWWKRGGNNFNKIFSPSYINKAKLVRNWLESCSETDLRNIKEWIVSSLKDEVRLIDEKIIWNHEDIKFYLENEDSYNKLLLSIVDANEIDLNDFERYLNFLSVINSFDFDSLKNFSISELEPSSIKTQIELITEIIERLISIKNWIKWILNIEDLFKKNYDLMSDYKWDNNLYDKKLWAKILELVNDKYDYLEKKPIRDVSDLFKNLNCLRKILDELNLDWLNYLDLRDFRQVDILDKADDLLTTYIAEHKSLLWFWSTFKKKKLTNIIRSLNKLLPNTSFRKLSIDEFEIILEDEIFLIGKLHSLLKNNNLSIHESIDEINFILNDKIDLSFLHKKDNYLDLDYFNKYNVETIQHYVELGDLMKSISDIQGLVNIDYDFEKIKNDSYIDFEIEGHVIDNIDKIKVMTLKDYQNNLDNLVDTLNWVKHNLMNLQNNYHILEKKNVISLNDSYKNSFVLLWFDVSNVLSFNKDVWLLWELPQNILRYLEIKNELQKVYDFYENNISYYDEKKKLENKSSNVLFADVLSRFLTYYNSHKNDSQILRKLFQWKIDISENNEEILNLLQEFLMTVWVVIVNIRDIFQYFPLKKDLFDVIIIDEASQVSIWQAFMLLPLAKKVVVLWDRKQYPNVIALRANKKLDDYYFEEIRSLGRNDLEKDKLDIFRVRNSVLDYMKSLNNFEVMLRYHFRSYSDLISFSNKTYYEWQLIIPKIRTKKIEEVIKFDDISNWDTIQVNSNTNKLEWDFILNLIQKLKKSNYTWSLWILTPFKDQQKYIHTLIFESDIREWFYEEKKWIVATFDTCQWQEKDYIIYSMVTNWSNSWAWSGNLNKIFPVSFSSNDSDIKLREARLNVWFSRAKETIHFVMSTDVERIGWTIWITLRHYKSLVDMKINESELIESPMEKKIVEWIEETDFYKDYSSDFIMLPQFEIWEYLKQINNASIPSYRVDLLCVMKKWWAEKVFIIEYDWYEFHFDWNDRWKYWLENISKDVERQKIIEYYWYQFLRYNKFNIWIDPVSKIDSDLTSVYESIVYVDPIEVANHQDEKNIDQELKDYSHMKESVISEESKVGLRNEDVVQKTIFDWIDKKNINPQDDLHKRVLSYSKNIELSRVIQEVSEWIIVNDLIDYNSYEELELLDKIKSTNFYARYKDDFYIIPQFPIWLYLNKKYWDNMPAYKLDFILMYKVQWTPKIIAIEYDWFEYHKDKKDKDIVRQRRIEKYWISFVRFDKNNSKWVHDVDIELSSISNTRNLIDDIYWDILN